MCTHHSTFKNDTVGSFLRPERLKKARLDFEENKISLDTLRSIEDEEIIKLIAKQKEVGLDTVSDGEFRQSYWHLDFSGDSRELNII